MINFAFCKLYIIKYNITMSKKETEKPILADEVLGKSEAFVIKHKNKFVGTIVAIVAIVVAYLAYNTFVAEPKEAEAAKAADNNTVSPYCLLQAGLIYEKQGNKADALKVYTQIKEKYYASIQAMDIDKYINRVK